MVICGHIYTDDAVSVGYYGAIARISEASRYLYAGFSMDVLWHRENEIKVYFIGGIVRGSIRCRG